MNAQLGHLIRSKRHFRTLLGFQLKVRVYPKETQAPSFVEMPRHAVVQQRLLKREHEQLKLLTFF